MTALIQVSTIGEDFIVDPFPLHSLIKTQLNDVFENASILKVFCGAQNDAFWLQRDFNVRVVGGIDVQLVHNLLRSDEQNNLVGLKELSEIYTPMLKVDKTARLEDWRRRPLTAEMINYARKDTRILMAIWNRMIIMVGFMQILKFLRQHDVMLP